MNKIIENKIKFIGEQDGKIERQLKEKLSTIFFQSNGLIRAYLACMQYESSKDVSVALCIKSNNDVNEILISKCASIFQSIFSRDTPLDIHYITNEQEQDLRQLCYPFYTSDRFQITHPDFYLSSHESKFIEAFSPISCYKKKRLYGDHKDGYVVCDIDPYIIGQPFGLGSQDIDQIIISSRFEGMSLFPITEWPTYVYVARPLTQGIHLKDFIESTDMELIAWAEINRS